MFSVLNIDLVFSALYVQTIHRIFCGYWFRSVFGFSFCHISLHARTCTQGVTIFDEQVQVLVLFLTNRPVRNGYRRLMTMSLLDWLDIYAEFTGRKGVTGRMPASKSHWVTLCQVLDTKGLWFTRNLDIFLSKSVMLTIPGLSSFGFAQSYVPFFVLLFM